MQYGEIRIESPLQMMSLTSTISLEPEPAKLDTKVILMGDRQIYYLLAQADPEFNDLFKVAADFDDEFTPRRRNDHSVCTTDRQDGAQGRSVAF